MKYKLSDAIAAARQEIYDEYASKGSSLKFGNGHEAIWLDLPFPENKARLFFAARKGKPYDYDHILLQLIYPKSLGSKDTPQAKWNDDYSWLKPFNYTKDNYFSLEDRCVESHGGIDNPIPEYEFEHSRDHTIMLAKRMLEFYFNLIKIKNQQS